MLVGSSVRISSVCCESADIGGSCIPFQTTIIYLGVHLDQTPSMKQHISSLCRTMSLALKRIASICLFLSNSSTKKLVVSMITSRLEYCNAIFTGVADEQITRIQKIQNNATRLIFKKSKRDHVTPLLKELHWLPVKYCIQYKLAARFPSLWRHSSAIPVFFSLHISTIALPSFFDRKTAQNSKNKLENLRWMLFWLHCSSCLELTAGWPESLSQLSKLT